MAGKVYELLLRSNYAEQVIINRWFYGMAGTPATVTGSFALMSAAGFVPVAGDFPADSMADIMKNLVSTSYAFEEAQTRDLYSVTDFYGVPFTPAIGGAATGEPMSPFLAYSLTGSRVRTDIRRGQKRIAGCTETGVGTNGEIASGTLTQLNSLAAAMSDPLIYDDEGNTLTFTPLILSFQKLVDEDGKVTYEKYSTDTAQLEHAASGFIWSGNAFVTSQNSRKRGRGA